MKSFYKILLIIIAIAYLISPVDLIPDFMIPYVGWLDDGVVLWLIFYYLKFNRLPSFFYRQKKTGLNGQSDSSTYNSNTNTHNNGTFSNSYNSWKQDQNHSYGNTNHEDNNYTRDNGSNQDHTSNRNNTDNQNKQSKKSPYEILGVDKNATEQEIRAAYRKLVKQYHPDRVASLGKEFQELANKKFIEIKEAYNTLMGL